jgi:hypothetical protein
MSGWLLAVARRIAKSAKGDILVLNVMMKRYLPDWADWR